MTERKTVIRASKEATGLKVINSNFQFAEGSDRSVLETEAEDTQFVGNKVSYGIRKQLKEHPIRTVIIALAIGIIAGVTSTVIGGVIVLKIQAAFFA